MRRRTVPPIRHCQDCGCAKRTWRDSFVCDRCKPLRRKEMTQQTMREARLIRDAQFKRWLP